jgi:hypothetical protein
MAAAMIPTTGTIDRAMGVGWKAENLEIIKGQTENWRGPTTDYWPPVNRAKFAVLN